MTEIDRPNILLIMVDQLRADHAGFLPGAVFSTPHIASLRAGTVFTNCLSANPVCMPARCALLTGRYTHQIGTLAMAGDLDLSIPTFPQALQRAGYWTAHVGKLHALQPWPWGTPRGGGVDLTALREKLRTIGFDHLWETAGKQLAARNTCDWCAHLDAKGILEQVRDYVGAAGTNSSVPSAELDQDGKPWPFDEADHVDVVTGDRALEALQQRPRDRPFFLTASFCSPHKPFDPPTRFLDAVEYEEVDDFLPSPDGSMPSPTMKKILWRLRRAYRATVALVDEQIGRLLAELEAEGLRENTLILFTTDHGEMMGDHGLVQKQSFYRQSLTVPTAIVDPSAGSAHRCTHPVEFTDLTATMLDAAGLDPVAALSEPWPDFRDRIPGRSLLPVVRGDAPSTREFAFAEGGAGRWQCVQSARWKYVRELDDSVGFRETMFDLAEDPDELTPVEAADALREHRDHLDALLMRTPPVQSRWAPFGAAAHK